MIAWFVRHPVAANLLMAVICILGLSTVSNIERETFPDTTASTVLDRMFAETAAQLSRVSASLDGSSSLTTAEVRVLQYLPTHLSFPQIAEELCVSRHTVKTQALSAYRKLGVHTRGEAIERARRAGLLPSG